MRTQLSQLLKQLSRDDSGQDLIEYALLSAVLAVGCITGILEITRIIQFFERIGEVLASAI